jgi:hypothetical protein
VRRKRVNRQAATQPARGVRNDLTAICEALFEASGGGAKQEDVHDVVPFRLIRMPAVLDRTEIGCAGDDALREQEPRGQRAIVPRRPHDDGERPALKADFERFFDRREIGLAPLATPPDSCDGYGAVPVDRRRRACIVGS